MLRHNNVGLIELIHMYFNGYAVSNNHENF